MYLKKVVHNFINQLGYDIIYFQEKEKKVFSSCKEYLKNARYNKSGVFFDIGAAAGVFSKKIIESFPNAKIFMIEPNLEFFLKLKKFFIGSQFTIFNKIAYNKKNYKKFYNYNNKELSSIYRINNKHEFNKNNNKYNISYIETVKLDDIVKKFNIKMIDLVKIDVQGSEMQVLEGLKKTLKEKKIYMLLVEVSCENNNTGIYENNSDVSELISFMNKYNYKIFSILDISINIDKSIKQLEFIFINKNFERK
jgi:FkbM family methyltransferase